MTWLRNWFRRPPTPKVSTAPRAGDPLASLSSDEIRSAALELIYERVSAAWRRGWMDHKYAQSLEMFEALRHEYATLEPPRLRREVMAWIEHYAERTRDDQQQADRQQRIVAALREAGLRP